MRRVGRRVIAQMYTLSGAEDASKLIKVGRTWKVGILKRYASLFGGTCQTDIFQELIADCWEWQSVFYLYNWISQAFVANARPGGGLARMADSHPETFPAIIRTRILVPAEQGNQVKFLDTWKSCSGQTDRTKKDFLSSCIYKVLFPCR